MPMPTASTQMDAFTAAVRPPPRRVPLFVGSPRDFHPRSARLRRSSRVRLSPRRSRAAPSSPDQGKTGAGIVPPRMDRQAPPLVPLEHKFSHGLGDVPNDAFYDVTTSDLAFGDTRTAGWGKQTVSSGLWTGKKANDVLCPTVGARRAKSDAKKAAAAAEMAGVRPLRRDVAKRGGGDGGARDAGEERGGPAEQRERGRAARAVREESGRGVLPGV